MRVQKKDKDGDLIIRDVLVAAFFCQGPHSKLAKPFNEVFALWSSRVGDDAKRWALVGPDADETKPVDKRLLSRALAQLDPAKAKKSDMYALTIGGPEEINPAYQFAFEAANDLEDEETNFLELRLPSEEGAADKVEATVEFLCTVAEKLPFDSGYAALGLPRGTDSQAFEYLKKVPALAFRHPGFDLPNSNGSNSGLGQLLRGTYWLNFLGPEALKGLGGSKKLRKQLDPKVEMRDVGHGVLIRVGKVPEVGDVNQGDNLPLLRSVAKVLEPVSKFDDTFLDHFFPDESARERWERRHLD